MWTAKTELFENAYVTSAIITLFETDNVDGEHFISFSDKNASFKFIWLSVDRRPIRRKCCVLKFIWLSVDVASVVDPELFVR